MGYIKEETKHPDFDAEIVVDEKIKDEVCDEWEIVGLSISSFTVRTPDDLISLGEWLVENGKRIKQQYTPKGKKRKVVV